MKNRLMCCVLFSIVGMTGLVGCAKAPDKALSDAEKALLAAAERKDCAREKYAAAESLLGEARALVKQKKYDEAERKALAAQRVAIQARQEADASWEECNKRQDAVAVVKQEPKQEPADTTPTLSTVYFAYDSAELTEAQRQVLDQNAVWMRQNAASNVTLEGHTDERGSVEYNLALGERRASSAKDYLSQLGIPKNRLRILSYGEEKPASFGSSEDNFRLNRRVDFVPEGQ